MGKGRNRRSKQPQKKTTGRIIPVREQKDQVGFFGHPKGLAVLFLTEMWERFSYYGMRALLVLYMTDYLFLKPDAGQTVFGFDALRSFLQWQHGPLGTMPLASHIYGLYTGLVYATPFFGGMLADRWLGQRRTVVLGAILMIIGHFLMAVESMFFPALCFLIFGNGAFKPNISVQVGDLYAADDPRRDKAFTIFYMGINLGAFFAPLVCGTLGQKLGWHYGFGAAGVGMVIGLIIYLWGQRYLSLNATVIKNRAAQKTKAGENRPLTPTEWKGIGALIFLCLLNVVFWAVYEQQGNTMQIWADKRTDFSVFGLEMPSTWYQSFNPLGIFILAPLLTIFWKWQNSKGKEPTSVTKMAIGCVLLGLAFCVMIAAASQVGPEERGSLLWLVMTTLVLTIGELYLSPIGLSLVTKVAPVRMVSMMMGMWFLSSFLGNYLSGYLGSFYESMGQQNFFTMMASLAGIAGLAMFAFNRPLKAAIGHR